MYSWVKIYPYEKGIIIMGLFTDVVKSIYKDEIKEEAMKAAGELDNAVEKAGDELSKVFNKETDNKQEEKPENN